jgi:hypothetical protein
VLLEADTENVLVVEPSYGPPVKPLPVTKSGKSVVPTNEPLNEPVATTPVKVKPSTVVAVAPKSIVVLPIVTSELTKLPEITPVV